MCRISKQAALLIAAGLASGLAAMAGSSDSIIIKGGTTLDVQLITTLSSKTNQNGDPWMGKTIQPIFANNQEAIPEGSTVDGKVTFVKEAHKVKGTGEMRLVAETITTPDGTRYDIATALKNADAESVKSLDEEGTVKAKGNMKEEAKDAAIGAGIGAGGGVLMAGSGTGALYGAGIGLIAGIVHGMLKHGKELILPQGTELTFTITRTVEVKKATGTESAPFLAPNNN
jgi:hypothetical protein